MGGELDRLPAPISFRVQSASAASPPDGVPVVIESTPTGAELRIDGANRGVTPAKLSASPGLHGLVARQAGSIELVRQVDVPPAGTTLFLDLVHRPPVEHHVDLGSSEASGTHALVVDRETGLAWIASIATARAIVRAPRVEGPHTD